MYHAACVVAFINHSVSTYHGATKFVVDCLNVVHGLLVTVYMSWGCSTQLAQYSNFLDVCMMTQDLVRPVKEQSGTELDLKLNTHSINLEQWSQHQRH